MVANGEVDQARIAVQQAIKADPSNRELVLLKGQIAVESGNPDLAISELTRLMADPALAPRVRDHLARAYLMAGNARRALEVLDAAASESALAFAVRTGALTKQGKGDAAAQALAQGLAKHPDAPELLVLDGNAAVALGDIDRAADVAAHAIRVAPGDIQARLLAGRVAMIDRRFAEAETHFDAVLAKRPRFQTALLAKATMAMDRGDRATAEELLKQAADQLGEGAPAIAYFRAQLAFDAGRTDEAFAILQKMGDTSAFPPATMLSGLVAAKRGQHEQAIAQLRQYLGDGFEDGRARLALAASLAGVGEKQEAWTTIRPLANAANASAATLDLAARLAAESGAPEATRYRERASELVRDRTTGEQLAAASKAMRAGDWAKADAIHARLLAADPGTGNVVLLNNAAYAKLERGDAAGAVALGKRALALAPDDAIVLDTVAWAMFKASGPSPEARAMIRRAAAAMPGNVQIRRHAIAIEKGGA